MTALNLDEIRQLNELKAAGYKISLYADHRENSAPCPICLLCSTHDIDLTTFSVDDTKKEAFVFSLCAKCIIKIVTAEEDWQKILDRRTHEVLTQERKRKELQ